MSTPTTPWRQVVTPHESLVSGRVKMLSFPAP